MDRLKGLIMIGDGMCIYHSVVIWEFLCHSDFKWNQFGEFTCLWQFCIFWTKIISHKIWVAGNSKFSLQCCSILYLSKGEDPLQSNQSLLFWAIHWTGVLEQNVGLSPFWKFSSNCFCSVDGFINCFMQFTRVDFTNVRCNLTNSMNGTGCD